MAADKRLAAAPVAVARQVVAAAPTSEFFQVVSLLERMSTAPVRLGGDGPPRREPIRFRHDPSMAFSAGDIAGAVLRRWDADDQQVDLVCTFLGLSGSSGPLPLHMRAETAHEEVTGGNRRRFLDVFHHRLMSLFYRLWSHYSLVAEAESDARDAWSLRALCLAGYDGAATGDDPIALADRLYLLPTTLGLSRTAHGLRLALLRVLGEHDPPCDVRVEQWTGGYVRLDPAQRLRLGTRTAILGHNAVLGERVLDRASGIRLHIGPLAQSRSQDYLAGGAQYRAIAALIHSFVREPVDYELRLRFGGERVAGFRLSRRAHEPLGRRSFLRGTGKQQTLTVRCSSSANEMREI